MNNSEKTMEKIVALCKGRGFVYPGSEIYGGLSNSWDYGPLGVELKNNIKKVWWQKFVKESVFNVGIDSAILMNPQVWVASGHVVNFNDPLIDCKNCKMRYRADNLIEDWNHQNNIAASADSLTFDQLTAYIEEHNIPCPTCGAHNFTGIRKFNMMFKTHIGVTEDSSTEIYLRPETAQGMFVNFKNILRTTRRKLPFGICQIGKSFRNEITPGNFIFRIREFEQMELEFFCKPGEELQWFDYWRSYCKDWLTSLGVKEENLRMRDHEKEKLSHYSNATTDIEYLFPFGWGELWGIASRTNFDLRVHSEHSGEDLTYFDAETNEHYLPYCVEPSVGVDRLFLMAITEAYDEEVTRREKTTCASFCICIRYWHHQGCRFAAFEKLAEPAVKIYSGTYSSLYGGLRRNRLNWKTLSRQDEIGTPYCVTYDFESENDGCVTVRDRDTMSQVRIPIGAVADYIAKSQII